MIKANPFTSNTFVSYWSKHFIVNKKTHSFDFANGISFYKSKFSGLYINVGKNLTKGMSYRPKEALDKDAKGKTFLIYDVPTFFEVPEINHKSIKLYRATQYPGFLINLSQFQNLEDFMVRTFKKSSRYKLKKYKKKLESCFDIHYKMFCGEISKEEYDYIFKVFKELLIKRFNAKQITNNNLEKEEWDFYHEVAYPMLLEKKAGLFVVYDVDKPIGITLCYFSEEILFDAITVFDIDYSKFHLGSVNIMKLVDWSLNNGVKIFDFSKGYFDYKARWASQKYDFQYHILYDSSSLGSRVIAFGLKKYFVLKQFLRNKNVNKNFHRFTFWTKNVFSKEVPEAAPKYEFMELRKDFKKEDFVEIPSEELENQFLKNMIFDFLYLNNEHHNSLKVFKKVEPMNTLFMFCGKERRLVAKVFEPTPSF